MRVLFKDLKQKTIRLQPEDGDDIWYLSLIVEEGDLVKSVIERKIKIGSSEAKQKSVKKRMSVLLEVRKTEFHGSELRILGTVRGGSEDAPKGSSQGVSIRPSDEITIIKEWSPFLLRIINESVANKNVVLVCLFDRSEARIFKVTNASIEEVAVLKGETSGKMFNEAKQSSFYKEIITNINKLVASLNPAGVIMASPAFWSAYLKKEMAESEREKFVFVTVSDIDRTAIRELLGRPEVKKLLQSSRCVKELSFLNDMRKALAREQLTYGLEDVLKAINEGNVSAVFITQEFINKARVSGTFGVVSEHLRKAESCGAQVHIITTDEPSFFVNNFGGLVVVKRW